MNKCAQSILWWVIIVSGGNKKSYITYLNKPAAKRWVLNPIIKVGMEVAQKVPSHIF